MATLYGSASWFCCGHGRSYSGPPWNCSDRGHGSCASCESYSRHCAWPKLARTNYPVCDVVSSCRSDVPTKKCGSTIRVYSQCDSRSVSVTVRDCGPNANNYCNTTCGCPGQYGPWQCSSLIDLTPAAFTRLADAGQGRIPVKVNA